MSLTMGQALAAKRIKARNPGASYRYVAKKVGGAEGDIRNLLDAPTVYPKHVKAARKNYWKDRKTATSDDGKPFGRVIAGIAEPDRPRIPDDVAADQRRLLDYEPPTLTAALFGDPPPWRSALAKRGGA